LIATETQKATDEGERYVWTQSQLGRNSRVCYNPKSQKAYLVTHIEGELYRCQCPRFQNASLCKHVLDARLRQRFA
jgi:hypothetical protein